MKKRKGLTTKELYEYTLDTKLGFHSYYDDRLGVPRLEEPTYRDFLTLIIRSNSSQTIIEALNNEAKDYGNLKYNKLSKIVSLIYEQRYKDKLSCPVSDAFLNVTSDEWLNTNFSPGAVLALINYLKSGRIDYSHLNQISTRQGGCLGVVILLGTIMSSATLVVICVLVFLSN
ncbi:Uncharacterised protein [Chryseobacterium taklimakanense]|uniref:Uncharacterized protein n=1 Tax=Chryseobacterium taklimakanense TaxID=536441 RepID=A0A239X4V3_9FLAO|nr:hypothetical protein [Chryseobacterium taklimakanense]SNV41436.1 Uncharacterised protein [Chryseobacterium taklimakanense]